MTFIEAYNYYKKATKLDKQSPTARQRELRNMETVKNMAKAFMIYGKKGAGYYYEYRGR